MTVKKIKKIKKIKAKTNESSTVNSKASSTKVLKEKAVQKEVLDESALPIVNAITKSVVEIVVGKLKPDIELAVGNRFDEIKKIVTSEVQDIRKTIESKMPNPQLEQSQVQKDVAVPPSNGQVRGLENNTMRNPQVAPKNSSTIEALLPSLLQLVPSLLSGNQASGQASSMPNMLVELMMKKFVADMGRSDTQNQAVTDYLLKQMLKRDPSILSGMGEKLTKSTTESESNQEHY